MATLLEAIGIVLETHFGFGFPNTSPIGDSLKQGRIILASFNRDNFSAYLAYTTVQAIEHNTFATIENTQSTP